MYLSELQIENFKSFKRVGIVLNERINLFTGANNTGKSTLLEAISLWHECYGRLLQQAGKATKGLYQQGDYTFGPEAAKYLSYNDVVSVRSPAYEDLFHNFDTGVDIVLKGKLVGTQSLWIGFRIKGSHGDNYKISFNDYKNFDYKTFNDRNFIKNPENALKVTFASPIANIAPVEEWQHPKKIEALKRPHTSYLVFRNRLDALNKRNQIDGGAFDKLCEQLSLILLDNPGQIKFFFQEDKGPVVKVSMQMGATKPKDISLYGSGTLQLIEILLNIHEQKTEGNLVLLDEPDSHIHRQLQARLLRVLQASEHTQVFMTTHNEALIREADPSWIFHLEPIPEKTYYPIQRNKDKSKGLLSSAQATVIQTLTGKGNGLDFVNALEADVLWIVEGVNDALRIQKLLSLKNNALRKHAYWVMGNVDTILDQIAHYKNVFEEIKNNRSLWEKTVLVFDKDYLTDGQRERLTTNLKNKLKLNKVNVWSSYCFDSILFSDLSVLSDLLTQFIQKVNPDKTISKVSQTLRSAIEASLQQKNVDDLVKQAREQINIRTEKFKTLGFFNPKVVEDDYHLKEKLTEYFQSCLNIGNYHKIMNKNDCDEILQKVFKEYEIPFSMEWRDEKTKTFNDFFDSVTLSTTYPDWEFVMNV